MKLNAIFFTFKIFISATLIFALGCSTQQNKEFNETQVPQNTNITIDDSDYENIIEKFTDKATEYDGLHNTLEVNATILNTEVSQAISKRKATTLNWNKEQFDKDYTDRFLINSKNSEFFVSFYTPERKNNDLTRSETLWKVILTAGGNRYEGKVSKYSFLVSEIQNIFPFHTHWNNAYIITFNVPISEIEFHESSLTISGPLASQVLKFKKSKLNK